MAEGLRFLLDENQRPETAAFLRNLGYDVETAQEAALSAAPDSRIAKHAKKTGRVIITFNYDFADMTQVFPHDVPGIIRLRVEPQIPEKVNPLLKRLFDRHAPDQIMGHLVTVTPTKIRFRKL